MAQRLKVLAAKFSDLSWIPSWIPRTNTVEGKTHPLQAILSLHMHIMAHKSCKKETPNDIAHFDGHTHTELKCKNINQCFYIPNLLWGAMLGKGKKGIEPGKGTKRTSSVSQGLVLFILTIKH